MHPKVTQHKIRHTMHWAFVHTACTIFLCDVIAVIYAPFAKVWEPRAHMLVALAAFLAVVPEYISERNEH